MTAPQSTQLPDAPQRNEPEAVFIPKANTFVASLEPFRVQLQAQADDVNDNTIICEESALAAKSSEEMALSAGNYIGIWADLTGSADKGISVAHNGQYWGSLVAIADITLEEPSVSADWQAIGSELGTAATKNTGTNQDQIPLNSDLGTSSVVDTGTDQNQIELNSQKSFKSFDSLTRAVAFVTANPASLKRLSTASYRSEAECTALSIAYPDTGKADYVVIDEGTGTDDSFIYIDAGTKQLKLDHNGVVNMAASGAVAGVAVTQHEAMNNAIIASRRNFKLIISPSASGVQSYYVDSTVFMNRGDLNIEFTGGAYLLPEDSLVQVPLVIGGILIESGPSNLYIVNPSVQRPSLNLVNSTRGILFGEMNQSTVINAESRYSTYNLMFFATEGACAYNTFINPQAIGGERNFYLESSGTGFTNENTFIGGRGFGTVNLVTNLYLSGGGSGTGHNRFLGMSLESSFGDQAIWDNAHSNQFSQCRTENSNGWNSPNGAGHVMGSNCFISSIQSSRQDYVIDQSAAADPRAQIIAYQDGWFVNTAVNQQTSLNIENQSAAQGSCIDTTSTLDTSDSFVFRAYRKAGALLRASLTTAGTYFGRAFHAADGGYSFEPLKLGNTWLWMNGGLITMRQSVKPTSATDGNNIQVTRSGSAAGFNSTANTVNNPLFKYTGAEVWDTTTLRPVWSTGALTTSVWKYSDGTTAYTPS